MSELTVLSGTTAGLNLAEGIFGMSAADARADSLRSQLSLIRAESEADIVRYADKARGLKAEQSVKYLKSGVTLEGSPLEILDETVRVSSENISAMRAKTTADILTAKSQISAIRGQGRAALVGGFSKAASVFQSQKRKLPGASSKELKSQVDTFSTKTGFDEGSYK